MCIWNVPTSQYSVTWSKNTDKIFLLVVQKKKACEIFGKYPFKQTQNWQRNNSSSLLASSFRC